uniref:Hexosyltransferase n=1 Tax=Mesocestoides corti TaxID=53468 RepID=A0A5K3FVX2_MESCO
MVSTRRIKPYLTICTAFGAFILFVLWHKSARNAVTYPNSCVSCGQHAVDYRIPDFDGTNSSCRCARGPRVYRWPPKRVPEDLICADSSYDLTLCVRVKSSSEPMETRLHQRLKLLDKDCEHGGEESALLRWFELEGHRLDGGEGGYDMYPLAINLTDTLAAITHGKQAPYALITNPNIKLIRTSLTACAPHDRSSKDVYDLVVIYKSAPCNFEERSRIREATRNLPGRIRVVFSLGQPRADLGGNLFHMNGGFDIRLPGKAGAKAVEWARRATEARERALAEADKFGDMIIGDYVDTYVNLTYKLIASHRWASAFCRGKSDVFVFIDDDYAFHAGNVLNYLNGLTKLDRRQLLSGLLLIWELVNRPVKDTSRNKWAVSRYEIPWLHFAPFASGGVTFVGADVLRGLVVAEAYTRFLYGNDAFMGFAAAKLPFRRFQSMKGFYLESTNNLTALIAHSPLRF